MADGGLTNRGGSPQELGAEDYRDRSGDPLELVDASFGDAQHCLLAERCRRCHDDDAEHGAVWAVKPESRRVSERADRFSEYKTEGGGAVKEFNLNSGRFRLKSTVTQNGQGRTGNHSLGTRTRRL